METTELLQPHLELLMDFDAWAISFGLEAGRWNLEQLQRSYLERSRSILVTASGKDKGHLERTDFVIVDEFGKPVPDGQPKSSAETLLHCSAVVVHRQAGSVLHTHSVHATILSDYFAPHRGIQLEGFEFLKGIEGITTHESRLWLPIFENTQDIPILQRQVRSIGRVKMIRFAMPT